MQKFNEFKNLNESVKSTVSSYLVDENGEETTDYELIGKYLYISNSGNIEPDSVYKLIHELERKYTIFRWIPDDYRDFPPTKDSVQWDEVLIISKNDKTLTPHMLSYITQQYIHIKSSGGLSHITKKSELKQWFNQSKSELYPMADNITPYQMKQLINAIK